MRDDASELLLSTLILVLILSRMMLIVIIIMAIMLKMVGALHALVNLSKVLVLKAVKTRRLQCEPKKQSEVYRNAEISI